MRRATKLRRLIRAAQTLVPDARRGVTVLAYHLFDAGTESLVDLPLETLRLHLDWLRSHARVVSLVDADPLGPADQVVLTFDDAYQNFYETAWPLLQERGLPATLYVPLDYVDGGPCPIRDTDLPACTWAQLREMADAGLDIGSHTFSHPDLRTVEGEQLEHEIAGSRTALQDRLGHPVRTFCYPRAMVTAEAAAVVERSYQLGVVGGGRQYGPRTARGWVPRMSLRRDHAPGEIAAMVQKRVWIEEFAANVVRQRLS